VKNHKGEIIDNQPEFPPLSIADGRYGPIAKAYDIHSWTSVFLIDKRGTIRQRDLRGPDLAKAIQDLLAE
jgi:hypothetical protein